MCLVCVEYAKQKLTTNEAMRNIQEMRQQVGEKHYNEVYNKLYDDYLERQLEEYWESIGFGD
tara:strand:+ start:924 stop:1109 length:186 start_codon:yes stop_codon:yes gene_type:complete